MQNIFTLIHNDDDTISVFLGDPVELGPEAETLMTLHKSLVTSLVATLSNLAETPRWTPEFDSDWEKSLSDNGL
jgi:hypothetical protein